MKKKNTLKEFRLKNRIKQCELAKASDIFPSALSLIENNWIDLSYVNTKKLLTGYKKINIDASRVLNSFLKQRDR